MNSFTSQNSGSGHKILPIFNMRKRPRQALYAVPSSQESIKADVLLSNPASQRKPASHEVIQPKSCYLQHADSSTSAQFKGNRRGASSSFNVSSKSNYHQSSTTQSKPQLNTMGHIQARKHPPVELLPSSSKVKSSRDQWSYKQNATITAAVPTKNLPQTFQKQSNTKTLEKPSCSLPLKQKTTFQSEESQMSLQDSFSSMRAKTTSDKLQTKETTGCSLRVLTLGVEGVKKWSQVLSEEMLMFEVFGLLNSEVTSNAEKTAKKFTLKDGNHTMQCIFYETDRLMPHLKKGQWIRCVGIFQNNITIFQCVSIREISLSEQRWMKAQMGATEKALKSHASVVKMEQ